MGKRRSDADGRRFFDEFEKVRISRFRAMGVVDPKRRDALIPFPNGKTKLIATKHNQLRHGGGWSFFVCPGCANRCVNLYLIDDAPRCTKCCAKLNIKHRAVWGFGQGERRAASDRKLNATIAKLETTEQLRLKTPKSWQGAAKRVYNSRRLTNRMRRAMIVLRLDQIAFPNANQGRLNLTRAYKAHRSSLAAIPELAAIWKANTTERLQQALDKAQIAIRDALKSDDPQIRIVAARLMLRTKQARERGIGT